MLKMFEDLSFQAFHYGTLSLRNGVLFVLAWMTRVPSCVVSVLAWVVWVACLRAWHDSVGGVGGVLA